MPTLSVCLLTRNQEADLPRALRSVAGLADQVLLADMASTNGTAPVAAELGAQVVQVPWDDDFAAGRNGVMRQATGDWILWLNADEELPREYHAAVRACLEKPGVFGYFVLLHNLLDHTRTDLYSETADLRLFRRRPDAEFVGRLHPRFAPGLVEALRKENLAVHTSPVVLRHYFRPWENDEAKVRWTLRLLEKELQDRPGQLPYLIELGRTLLLLKDPKGHAVMAEAAEQVLASRAAAAAPSFKVQLLLEYLLTVPAGTCPTELAREEARQLALRWFPSSPPLLWVNAEHFYQKGAFWPAAKLLERLIQLGKSGAYDRSRGFPPGLIGEDAWMNLAACYGRLGELDRAEKCYNQLVTSPRLGEQAKKTLAALQEHRRKLAAKVQAASA